MERGSTDDEVAARTGQSAQAVAALREDLARRLGLQLDEELGLAQAAALLGRAPASVVKMIQSRAGGNQLQVLATQGSPTRW